MSNTSIYCAVGDYGIEFESKDRADVEKWIAKEVAGEGESDTPVPDGYYKIVSLTQAELDALPEV